MSAVLDTIELKNAGPSGVRSGAPVVQSSLSLKAPPEDAPQSLQFDLFGEFFGKEEELSNTMELWDSIPKYSVSAQRQNQLRDASGRLPLHEMSFSFDGVECELIIQPALIKMEDGSTKDFYPSQNEEIIEEVLRKIFSDQQYGIHFVRNLESWVRFSVYLVAKELKAIGRSRSHTEIRRSLEIMSSAVLTFKMKTERKPQYKNPILTNMTTQTQDDLRDDPKAKWVTQLPALVSKCVNELGYRQYNYKLHWTLKSRLARYLRRRFLHRYRNASPLHSYHFRFSDVRDNSKLLTAKDNSKNIQTFIEALAELKEKKVLHRYERKDVMRGKEIIDIIITVWADMDFVTEMKASHARLNDGQEKLRRAG
jgi:hypothetical protein